MSLSGLPAQPAHTLRYAHGNLYVLYFICVGFGYNICVKTFPTSNIYRESYLDAHCQNARL